MQGINLVRFVVPVDTTANSSSAAVSASDKQWFHILVIQLTQTVLEYWPLNECISLCQVLKSSHQELLEPYFCTVWMSFQFQKSRLLKYRLSVATGAYTDSKHLSLAAQNNSLKTEKRWLKYGTTVSNE